MIRETAPFPPPALRPEAQSVPIDRQALAAHLMANGIPYDARQPVRQLAGGLANINYYLEIEGRPVVLRRPPAGDLPPGAHDMAREHRILSRLGQVLPFVPKSLYFCGDKSVIGVPFQLIEYRAGLIIRGSELGALAGNAEAAGKLSRMLVDTLARIHAVDPASVGLDTLGNPDGFVARAITGWQRRGFAAARRPEGTRLVQELSDWLMAYRFASRKPTLLHCDFKLDNVVLDPQTLDPVAVLDWDMGTRGDPMFDLATMLTYWSEPDDPDCMRRLDQMPTQHPGFWRRHAAAQAYAEATGMTLEDLTAMRVLGIIKLGVVFLQLHARWAAGTLGDARYAAFEGLGEELLAFGLDVAAGRAT